MKCEVLISCNLFDKRNTEKQNSLEQIYFANAVIHHTTFGSWYGCGTMYMLERGCRSCKKKITYRE